MQLAGVLMTSAVEGRCLSEYSWGSSSRRRCHSEYSLGSRRGSWIDFYSFLQTDPPRGSEEKGKVHGQDDAKWA